MQIAPWHKAPFLRILPPFLAGLLLADYYPIPEKIITTGFINSLALAFCFAARLWYTPHAWRWLAGLSLNLLLIFTGILLYRQQQVFTRENWLGHHLKASAYILATPEKIGTAGKKTSRYLFRTLACIDKNGRQKTVNGNFIAYLPAAFTNSFLPGDLLVFPAGNLQTIRSAGNPGSFDFARYSARQNLYHQGFFKLGQFKKAGEKNGFYLPRLLAYGQLSAMQSMRSTVPEKSGGLAMALLIGYRNEVDKDLLQAYTNTGVVHVIAVSGMHLGLIFLLLQRILAFPVNRFRLFKWIKAILVLLIIWLFSGVAGSAASILRAAFMFSITLLSKLIRKPMDNIQSICLGAFALLAYNPLWIWDAGFQLSFAALLSILCYQPLIHPWIKPKNPILKGTWELSAVTLAAQVLTLPISIGQFHQAPVYFLVSNLVAVPLSSIALITAIIQWAASSLSIPVSLPGTVTGLLIETMNAGILHVNAMPGAVINQIEWTLPQTITAYIIIIGFTSWFIKPNAGKLCFSLAAIALFGMFNFGQKQAHSRQELLLVLHIPRHRSVSVLQGNTLRPISPENLPASPELNAAARFFDTRLLQPNDAVLYKYGSCRIALPNRNNQVIPLLAAKPKFLFLPPTLYKIEPFLQSVPPGTFLVIDGTIPEWRAREWTALLRKNNVLFYSTWESGALQIPINKF